MLIKERIKYNRNDINIQIPLNLNNSLSGYQQEINNFSQVKTNNSINDVNDAEVKKFKLKSTNNIRRLFFYFYKSNMGYITTFSNAGFDLSIKDNFINSFFILDFFDSYNPTIQSKLFSVYLTKLYVNNKDGDKNISVFNLISGTQFYNLFVPNNIKYINNKYTGYTRFSFYNAKTGKITVFFNQHNETLSTPEKMYFKTILNLNDKTWDIVSSLTENSLNNILIKELTSSTEYVKKYNNSFDNFDNLKQNYPTGNYFNPENANYNTQ